MAKLGGFVLSDPADSQGHLLQSRHFIQSDFYTWLQSRPTRIAVIFLPCRIFVYPPNGRLFVGFSNIYLGQFRDPAGSLGWSSVDTNQIQITINRGEFPPGLTAPVFRTLSNILPAYSLERLHEHVRKQEATSPD